MQEQLITKQYHMAIVKLNFNLNTTSVRHANDIAINVSDNGQTPAKPGMLKCTTATGIYNKDYDIVQISLSISDLTATPLHTAFEEVCRCAEYRGIRVTGAELVTPVNKQVLITAGKHFLEKQHCSVGIPETDIIRMTVRSMGLDDLYPFIPSEMIIEYQEYHHEPKLTDLTINDFAEEASREDSTIGGGAMAAYMGALAAAVGTMVANISSAKVGWEDRWQEFSDWAAMGQDMVRQLLQLVNEEKTARAEAIQHPTAHTAQVPLRTMKVASQAFLICKAMAKEGTPSCISDAGAGALAARAAVLAAGLKVKNNAIQLEDRELAAQLISEADELINRANTHEAEIMALVTGSM